MLKTADYFRILDRFSQLLNMHAHRFIYKREPMINTWCDTYVHLITEIKFKPQNRSEINGNKLKNMYENYTDIASLRDDLFLLLSDGIGDCEQAATVIDFINKWKQHEKQFKSFDEFIDVFNNAHDFAAYMHALEPGITKKQILRVSHRFGFEFYWPELKSVTYLIRMGLMTKPMDIDRYQFLLGYLSKNSCFNMFQVHMILSSLMSMKIPNQRR